MKKNKLTSSIGTNIFPISVFISSFAIYFVTLSPTVNFWDCGEFISCAYKLEIGHAPGAPLYLLIARAFSLFANNQQVAFSINLVSAIFSALTVSFLYSTIVILVNKALTTNKTAALIASLTFAVSDTFWHSAIEAEVYALSLFFTATTFWVTLKWEVNHTNKHSGKWILLIAYLTGLSIGVHLLNLLIIPVIAIVLYTKTYGHSTKNYILSFILGTITLLFIQFIYIPHGLFFAKKLELLFINQLNLPVHSGLIFYIALLFIVLLTAILYFHRQNKKMQFITLCAFLFIFGTTSYATILIRSNSEPSINLNQPTHVFALESFINREQYGNRPLIKGPWFGAQQDDLKPTYNYRLNSKGKYETYPNGAEVTYQTDDLSYFPRMYSSETMHISGYQYWSHLKPGQKPNFRKQLSYLFKYQIGHMYFRYFMWNFSGKQNHLQGHGDFLKGNFLTGIPFIDRYSVGVQHALNSIDLTSKARNRYFMLPLIIGIIGIVHLFKKSKFRLLILLSTFFLMTGPIIALYLNQPPFEPRERDYVFVGSFYVFAIFIAIGAYAIIDKVHKTTASKTSYWTITTMLLLALPGLMFANNLNDHNRSDRRLARDLALSYLKSCDPNSILFTYGDNDTYPLWYLQEVEKVRTDVKIINIGLLSADWYIQQQIKKQNNTTPLSLTIPVSRYKKGDLDYVAITNYKTIPLNIISALSFIADTSSSSKVLTTSGQKIDFIPTKTLYTKKDTSRFIHLNKSYLTKAEIALLDLIATNSHNRSIYFTNGTPQSALPGLGNHTIPYGINTKLVLDSAQNKPKDLSKIFRDDIHINYPIKSWFDETCLNALSVSQLICNCNQHVKTLIKKGNIEEARYLLKKFNPLIPLFQYQYEDESIDWINHLYQVQLNQEADEHLEQYSYLTLQNISFYTHSADYIGSNLLTYAHEEYQRLKKIHHIATIHQAKHVKKIIEESSDIK